MYECVLDKRYLEEEVVDSPVFQVLVESEDAHFVHDVESACAVISQNGTEGSGIGENKETFHGCIRSFILLLSDNSFFLCPICQ